MALVNIYGALGHVEENVQRADDGFAAIHDLIQRLAKEKRAFVHNYSAARWRAHHDRFRETIREGAGSARFSRSRLDVFVDVQMPLMLDTMIPLEERKELLEGMILDIHHDCSAIRAIAESLQTLHNAVQETSAHKSTSDDVEEYESCCESLLEALSAVCDFYVMIYQSFLSLKNRLLFQEASVLVLAFDRRTELLNAQIAELRDTLRLLDFKAFKDPAAAVPTNEEPVVVNVHLQSTGGDATDEFTDTPTDGGHIPRPDNVASDETVHKEVAVACPLTFEDDAINRYLVATVTEEELTASCGADRSDTALHLILSQLSSDNPLRLVFATHVPPNQTVGEALQTVQKDIDNNIDRIRKLRLLLRGTRSLNGLPSSYYLKGVEGQLERPVATGGFGDVYKGVWQERSVALKLFRTIYEDSPDYRTLLREIVLWRQLNHTNINPFVGVNIELFKSRLVVLSDWQRHGSIADALKDTFEPNQLVALRPDWVFDIAKGLAYLHNEAIIHGDLRGANILIADDYHAQLTDFGLTTLVDASTRTFGAVAGAIPMAWSAPELLDEPRPKVACDVYSFACTCVEVYSGKRPFAGLNLTQICKKLYTQQRPARPVDGDRSQAMPEMLWKLVEECWREKPSERPGMLNVVEEMRRWTS